MELMVVVVLVALLATIAAPSMVRARNDRIAFDFARQTSELIHAARSRAVGRGAAHLILYRNDSAMGGTRGTIALFEALDGSAPNAGPNPQPSCRNADWTWAGTWVPGTAADTGYHVRLIDAVNVNDNGGNSVQLKENITMTAETVSNDGATVTNQPVFAMCITPNGTTYIVTGLTDAPTTVSGLATADTFTGIVRLNVARHSGATVAGLNRRIIVAGSAQPRIKSE